MQSDPSSLDLLHDIVLPAATAWWPPAPGWLWLLGFAALLLLAALVRGLLRWQHNRYRREALAELARLTAAAKAGELRAGLPAMSELLKRVALSAWPRQQVAGLSGTAWFDFLDSSGRTHFSQGLGALLEQATYRSSGETISPADFQRLTAEIRSWIQQHRVDLETPEASATVVAGRRG